MVKIIYKTKNGCNLKEVAVYYATEVDVELADRIIIIYRSDGTEVKLRNVDIEFEPPSHIAGKPDTIIAID